MIELTADQINELMYDNLEGYKVIYDGIPKPETEDELKDYDPNDYIDKNGDEMRVFTFVDESTGETHILRYKYSNEYGFNARVDDFFLNESIKIIPES